MEALTYKEWRNQNSESTFPFTYNNSEIDNTIFIDASLVVYEDTDIWLSSLSLKVDSFYGELKSGSSRKYTFSSNDQITPYKLIPIMDSRGISVGSIITGTYFLNLSNNRKSFSKNFDSRQILLNPTCLFTYPSKQVSSIKIGSQRINGFINFHEGPGVEMNGNSNIIVFDSIGKNSSNAIDECCDPNQIILKKINGISPEELDLYIKPRDVGQPSNTLDERQVIRINQSEGGIKIELTK
jgi:hypothetical protein